MTTYQHNLTLNDGEMIMIQSALLRMIVHCEANLLDGIKAPYWAHKIYATDVFNRLFDNSIIIGDYLKTNIEKLFKKFYPEETLEVRGIGLMIAVELINKIDKTPNTYLVGRLFY